MKKVLLPLVILCSFGFTSYSQIAVKPYMGITASSTTGLGEYDRFTPEFLTKRNLMYGLGVEKRLNKRVGVNAAIQWVKLGGINGETNLAPYPIYEIELEYIQPSLEVIYYLKDGLYFNAGGYMGKLQRALVDQSRGRVLPSYSYREIIDDTDRLRNWDVGMLLGSGFRYKNIDLNVCFRQGLVKLSDTTTEYGKYNQVIQLSLGYVFEIKKGN